MLYTHTHTPRFAAGTASDLRYSVYLLYLRCSVFLLYTHTHTHTHCVLP